MSTLGGKIDYNAIGNIRSEIIKEMFVCWNEYTFDTAKSTELAKFTPLWSNINVKNNQKTGFKCRYFSNIINYAGQLFFENGNILKFADMVKLGADPRKFLEGRKLLMSLSDGLKRRM